MVTTTSNQSNDSKLLGRIDFTDKNGNVHSTKYITRYGLLDGLSEDEKTKLFFNGQLYKLTETDYKTFLDTKAQYEAQTQQFQNELSNKISTLTKEIEDIDKKKQKLQNFFNDPDMKDLLSANTQQLDEQRQQKTELLEKFGKEEFSTNLEYIPINSLMVPKFHEIYVMEGDISNSLIGKLEAYIKNLEQKLEVQHKQLDQKNEIQIQQLNQKYETQIQQIDQKNGREPR